MRCAFPCCSREQTTASIAARVTAIALGSLVLAVGILSLCHAPWIPASDSLVGWTATAIGGISLITGIFVRAEKTFPPFSPDKVAAPFVVTQAHKYQPHFAAAKQELDGGISPFKPQDKDQIRNAYLQLKKDRNNPPEGVRCYADKPWIFSLDTLPGLIFKLGGHTQTEETSRDSLLQTMTLAARYEKMIFAKAVCLAERLDHLVIPHARLTTLSIGGKTYFLLVEEKLNIHQDESQMASDFERYADRLHVAIEQLTILICETGYCDVDWRNNPVLLDDDQGKRKIALVDLEHMGEPYSGIVGHFYNKSRGLIRCADRQHAKLIRATAEKRGVQIKQSIYESHRDQRREEQETLQKVKKFHQDRGITQGNERLDVEVDTLEFGFDEEKTKKLRALTRQLVNEINRFIEKHSSEMTVQARRKVFVTTSNRRSPFYNTNIELIDDERDPTSTYLRCAAQKLKELGVVFGFHEQGCGYEIQA